MTYRYCSLLSHDGFVVKYFKSYFQIEHKISSAIQKVFYSTVIFVCNAEQNGLLKTKLEKSYTSTWSFSLANLMRWKITGKFRFRRLHKNIVPEIELTHLIWVHIQNLLESLESSGIFRIFVSILHEIFQISVVGQKCIKLWEALRNLFFTIEFISCEDYFELVICKKLILNKIVINTLHQHFYSTKFWKLAITKVSGR